MGGRSRVAATSITRFLRDQHASWPSSRTLLALAKAAGASPPIAGEWVPIVRLPIIPVKALVDDDIDSVVRKRKWPQLIVTDKADAHCVAAHVTDDSLEAAGVLEGDTILIDPVAKPQHGHLVVFSDGNSARGAAYTDNGCVERRTAPAEPMIWPLKLIQIRGVIAKVLRDYAL